MWHDFHVSASFKGAALFLLNSRVGMRCEGPVPSNAAVMRRFARVVALPDLKIVIFPAEPIFFRTAGLQNRGRGVEMTSVLNEVAADAIPEAGLASGECKFSGPVEQICEHGFLKVSKLRGATCKTSCR